MSNAHLWTFGPLPVELPVDYIVKTAPVATCPGARFCEITRGGEPYWWGTFDAGEVEGEARLLAGLWLLIPRAVP